MIFLQDTTLNAQVIGAEISITSGDTVWVSGVAGLVAGSYIELNPGFASEPNSIFMASISPCDEIGLTAPVNAEERRSSPARNPEELPYLFVKKVKESESIDIYFRMDGKGQDK